MDLLRMLAGPSKFKLGQCVLTAGVSGRAAGDLKFAGFVVASMKRHAQGDWGELDAGDRAQNDQALAQEKAGKRTDRLFSMYQKDDMKIYIVTEWDRSVTTVLFPEEY